MPTLQQLAEIARRLELDHFTLAIQHAGRPTPQDDIAYRHHKHYANEYRAIARDALSQLNGTIQSDPPNITDLLP